MKNIKKYMADLIWVALIVAVVYGAMQFSQPVAASEGETTVRYTIELGFWYFLQEGFYENVVIGEPVFDARRGQEIGRVADVFTTPRWIHAFCEETRVVRQSDAEGWEFVYLVLEAPASITDYETLIGAFPVAVGREIFARSKFFSGAGFIVAVEHVR